MSKQRTLFDVAAFTDWQQVYDRASEVDRRIVDWVRLNPGARRHDIARALEIPPNTLDFRLWELAGRSTAGHAADGLLLAERRDADTEWRYYAREW